MHLLSIMITTSVDIQPTFGKKPSSAEIAASKVLAEQVEGYEFKPQKML